MLPGRLGLALPPTRRDDGVANVGKGVIGVFPIWEPPYQLESSIERGNNGVENE